MWLYDYWSDVGYIPRFDTESNTLSEKMPEGMYGSYMQPSDEFKSKGRAIIVQPVTGSEFLLREARPRTGAYTINIGNRVFEHTDISVSDIREMIGKPLERHGHIIMGNPVNINRLTEKEQGNLTTIYIKHPKLPMFVGIIVLIIVVIAVGIVMYYTTQIMQAWATGQVAVSEAERQKTLQAQSDLIAQRSRRTNHEEYDLNGDGTNDIAVDTFGSGEQVRYAISDYGAEVYGTDVEEINEPEPLPEGFMQSAICPYGTYYDVDKGGCVPYSPVGEPEYLGYIKWGIIGAVVIGGVVVAVKVVPDLIKKGGE